MVIVKMRKVNWHGWLPEGKLEWIAVVVAVLGLAAVAVAAWSVLF
jgi:hypothetical protein